jgi:membrane protein required for colicin V production
MQAMSLTTIDFLILAMLGLSLLLGLWRGLVRTLFGLGAWVISLLGAPFLAIWVAERFETPWAISIGLAFLVLFITTRLIGSLIARALVSVGLSGVDRLCGALFGAARGLLIVALFATLAHSFKLDRTSMWREAMLAPFLDQIVEVFKQRLEPLLPERLGGPTTT